MSDDFSIDAAFAASGLPNGGRRYDYTDLDTGETESAERDHDLSAHMGTRKFNWETSDTMSVRLGLHAMKALRRKGCRTALVSLSHDGRAAMAIVLVS